MSIIPVLLMSSLFMLPHGAGGLAQTAAGPLPCERLLTAAELEKAVAPGFQSMGPEERNPGESECSWMLRGHSGFKTVSLQFYDLKYIASGEVNNTPDAFFADLTAPLEGFRGKAEPLPGIGTRAALIPAEPQRLAVVQTPEGVARIVGNNLTRAQTIAVAKAVAAR